MGSLTRSFSADKAKETDGVWFEIVKNDDGTMARMRVLRMAQSNKKFASRYASLSKNARFHTDKRAFDRDCQIEAFVDGCLLEWQNIENINEAAFPGTEKEVYMPLTKDNAMKLFKALPDLFDMLLVHSTELENFQSVTTEEVAKN